MYNFPISAKKIRLGLIGCGRVSDSHLTAIEKNAENIDLIAVCDKNPELADLVANKFDTKAFYSIEDMIKKSNLDIVSIATPNGFHAEHAFLCIENKLHVITEKPIAISLEDGIKMVQKAQDHGVLLFVIHQNRYNQPIQILNRALKENRFGRIYMISSNVFWHRDQTYYEKNASWHGTKNIDGGAFFTQASHYIDLMQWVTNSKPISVYSKLKTLARNIETEDTGSAIIEWENGTIGSINLTLLTHKKNYEGSLTILGENGTVKIGGVALNKISKWDFANQEKYDDQIETANYETESVYGQGHIVYYKNLVTILRGGKADIVSGADSLESLKILSAIYLSNKENSPHFL